MQIAEGAKTKQLSSLLLVTPLYLSDLTGAPLARYLYLRPTSRRETRAIESLASYRRRKVAPSFAR